MNDYVASRVGGSRVSLAALPPQDASGAATRAA